MIYHVGWGDESWKKAALYCLAGGILGAVPAMITGYIDYGIITDAKAARVAKFHLYLNVITTILIIVSAVLRYREGTDYQLLPVLISLVAVILVGASGWLGGELVSTYGVSVKGVPADRSRGGDRA